MSNIHLGGMELLGNEKSYRLSDVHIEISEKLRLGKAILP